MKNVAGHPAFRETVNEFARLFHLRLADPAAREVVTSVSAETGNPVSRAYDLPRTAEEMRQKYAATEWWMRESWGQLGRAPDFMANVVVGIHDFRDELE